MSDKYDFAIEYLTEHPNEIYDSWNCLQDESSCLFDKLGKSVTSGCLTQIKSSSSYESESLELERKIRNDPRIPINGYGITVENLHVFAEYQRLADKMLPSRNSARNLA